MLGHAARTLKEALALADEDLDALTALLDVRVVAGDAELADELWPKVRRARAAGGATGSSRRSPTAAAERQRAAGSDRGDARART